MQKKMYLLAYFRMCGGVGHLGV